MISYWMRGDRAVVQKVQQHAPEALSIAAITYAEILYGIAKSPHHERRRLEKLNFITQVLTILPFEEATAKAYGELRSYLESLGAPISDRDIQIASTALDKQLILVTNNVREFNRVPDLLIEDWSYT